MNFYIVSEIEWEAMQRYSRMVLSTYYEEGLLSEVIYAKIIII